MLRYLQIRSSDIAKLISRAWKELPETDKSVWHHKAQLDRQRYDREKAAFKGPWKVPIVKDPNAPKKPMSAFLDYANERRRFIAEANPTMNGTEISCLLARLWRECPDDVRQRYRDREARERKIYKERRAQWERQKRELSESCEESVSGSEGSTVTPALHDSSVPSADDFWALDTLFATEVQQRLQPLPSQYTLTATGRLPTTSLRPEPLTVKINCEPAASFQQTPLDHTTTCVIHQNTASTARFDNYSIDDILQDEELFQTDFSPADVPSLLNWTENL